MRLGIFAKTFRGSDPEKVLGQARAAGFRSVQYNMACSGLDPMPDAIDPAVAKTVGGAAAREGLAIAALSGTYNMIHPNPALRADGLRRLEVLAGAAADIGTGLITLCTGTRDPDDQWRAHKDNDSRAAWHDLLVEMEKALAIADRYDLRLGIEPELGNVVNSAAKARHLIDALGSDRVVVILDPANLFEVETLERQRDIVSEAIELLDDRIVMGHAKDRDEKGNFATAGHGVLDYDHYVSRLKAGGFAGDLVAHGLAASEAVGVASFLATLFERQGIPLR